MNYTETLDYLFSQLPMFQRVGAAAYKADLSNTLAICRALDNPEKHLRYVHIAGTNGKGSTSHMIASALQEAGYKTGLYTSPHLKDFRERIRVNGEVISEDAVVAFVDQYKDKWVTIQPSFFEITVGMAFWYFLQEEVDVVVLETGMGGRLDSTNVVRPEVSVITSIGFDHTQFLGDTLSAIAKEKAGIIKPATPVVIGQLPAEAELVMEERAAELKAPLTKAASLEVNLPPLDLKGPFQALNARTAIAALVALRKRGFVINDEHIVSGLASVVKNTGLMGRWQVLAERPLTITDCAHNEEGLRGILQEVSKHDYHDLHIVLGVSNDKDLSTILPLFPKDANYYFASAKIPRAMPAEELHEKAMVFGLRGEYFPSVRKAYEAARLYATPQDLIYIGGSVFVVAEVV